MGSVRYQVSVAEEFSGHRIMDSLSGRTRPWWRLTPSYPRRRSSPSTSPLTGARPAAYFTPVLAEFYSDLVGAGEEFEIVFVSSDKTAEDQMAYMKESHGDWLAVQHNTVLATQLKKKYEVTGIPTL